VEYRNKEQLLTDSLKESGRLIIEKEQEIEQIANNYKKR